MVKILVIAPKSYPVDGAEAIVNIKLLRALCEDGGFEIDLISRKNSRVVYPSDLLESYGVKLNDIYVINNKGGFSVRVLLESIISLFVFKSVFSGCHWAVRALPIANRLIKKNRYDYVLTKSTPSFLIGAFLKKRGLKWVASWNDPYPQSFYPFPYGKGNSHKPSLLERLQLKQMRFADCHIFPSRALKDHMLPYLKVSDTICRIVPHVVFETKGLSIDNKRDCVGTLTIIHSGNLSAPRNPRPFINAFYRIVRDKPDVKIHLTMLGKMEDEDKNYISSIKELSSYIDIIPTVEYKKSLEILAGHDLACVIEANCGVGGGVFLPTKVTDFMQIHKPIFAISPRKGVLEDLYNEQAIGYFSDINDENSIYQGFNTIIDDYMVNSLKKSYIPSSFTPASVVRAYKEISSFI